MNHLLSSKDGAAKNKPDNIACTCDDPTKCLQEMFVNVVQKIRSGNKPTERPVFLRTHGILKGTISFNEDLDPLYQQGFWDPKLRKNQKDLPVYVRYSSDLSHGRPDLNSTVGIGIKIFGIEGPKVLDEFKVGSKKKGVTTKDTNVDLLLQNAPNFFVDNSRQMCAFTKAGFEGWTDEWIAQNSPITASILEEMKKFVPSALATDMWSVVPFRLGVRPGCKDDEHPDSYNYCKFIVRPKQSTFVGNFDTTDPNYLAKELAASMSAGSATLDVFIQVRPDESFRGKAYLEEKFPLDRATIVWDEQVARPIKVATIKIKKQDITNQQQEDYGNWLAFNIGRMPPLNRPVGSIAETRMQVYKYSAHFRHQANDHPTAEPTKPGLPKVDMEYPDPKSRPLTEEEMARITHVRVHPGIGVSRIGSSSKYYIGPEVMHPKPTPPELKNGLYADGSQNSMRDDSGALKRQAARFRVYGYDKDGRVVAEIQQSTNTSVEWTVHVANKKADWFYFIAAMDLPEYKDLKVKRRNEAVKPNARGSLVIDPGQMSIAGINTKDSDYEMTGHFRNVPVTLGELRTDACGRLLFLPGRGNSGSPSGQPPINMNDPTTFSNAKDWYDDIADGPVHARVTIGIGDKRQSFDADPGWVISAPPNYAPDIIGWRTMNDLMRNVFMDGGLLDLPERVSFTEHILPILRRLTGLQWVNKGFSSMFGSDSPMNFEDAALLSKLSQNSNGSPAPDIYGDLRRTIFNTFRSTDGTNEDKSNWPYIYGDTRFTPDSLEGED
ncbi:MAG: LodA/GoxA family CTQ-dependent oxidase, partial [Bacteroidota bacterium]